MVLIDINHTISWLSTSILTVSLNPTRRIRSITGTSCLRKLNWHKKVYFLSFRQDQDMNTLWKETKRKQPLPTCSVKVASNGRWWQDCREKTKQGGYWNLGGRPLLGCYKYRETFAGDHSPFHTVSLSFSDKWHFRDLPGHVQEVSLVHNPQKVSPASYTCLLAYCWPSTQVSYWRELARNHKSLKN